MRRPEHYAHPVFRKILIPVDFTSKNDRAFAAAREVEAEPLPAVLGPRVEARPGHPGHAGLAHQRPRELHVVIGTEAADVRHDVVGAPGRKDAKPRLLEGRQEPVAPVPMTATRLPAKSTGSFGHRAV